MSSKDKTPAGEAAKAPQRSASPAAKEKATEKAPSSTEAKSQTASKGIQMLIGFVGIYMFFMMAGWFTEDVVKKGKFKQSWMLAVIESFANVVLGGVFMLSGKLGGIRSISAQVKFYGPSGAAQVFAKYLTTLSMVYGVSFPVATCAKSAKMVPALIGAICAKGFAEGVKKAAKPRPWMQTALVVGGTCILSLAEGKKKAGGEDSSLGLIFLVCALACDGIVSFCQEQLREVMKSNNWNNNFEMQFLTNLYMFFTATVFMVVMGEFQPGMAFLKENPAVLKSLLLLAVASACGQGVIFYVVANLGPVFNSCVTTSRKVFSVLLSVLTSGQNLSTQGWSGISMVAIGVFGEVHEKLTEKPKIKDKGEKKKQ